MPDITFLVLAQDLDNPCADRRYRHDWRLAGFWPAGTQFEVVVDEIPDPESDRVHRRREIRMANRYYHQTIREGDPRFELILQAAAPAFPDVLQLLWHRDLTPKEVLTYLWEKGRFTVTDLDDLVRELEAQVETH